MRRGTSIIAIFSILIMTLALVLILVLAGGDGGKVEIENEKLSIGDTTTVTFVKKDKEYTQDEDLEWSSDDEDVATVSDDGVVTAVGPGMATITGKFKKDKSSVSVSVEAPQTSVTSAQTPNAPTGQTEQMPEAQPTSNIPKTNDPLGAAVQSGCAYKQNPATGHVYGLFNYENMNLNTFQEWESFCNNQGGHVAIIDDADENQFVYDFILNTYNPETADYFHTAYFGYSDQGSEGSWYWLYDNGGYTNWAPGQPNNTNGAENQAMFVKDSYSGQWNDSKIGTNSRWFICEWEK